MERFACAIYCDDIRQELGGKYSLMGCYRGDLILYGDLPATLPKLCVAAWVSTAIDDPIEKAVIRIVQNENEMISLDLNVQDIVVERAQEGKRDRMSVNAYVTLSPFTIEGPGVLRTFFDVDGETMRAGGLVLRSEKPPQERNA